MGSSLLANELTNLISESKRKNVDLRTAAEKSLQELKSLPATSEQQLSTDLSRRPAFVEPFLIACGTRNARFAGSGITCLQRLVISRGLPTARLQNALEAFNACTDLGLDIQLKVLQALPSLLQNYADDLKADLLSEALEVCSSLQSAKAQTVSGVAAATLQQLVTTVFEKVVSEDRHASEIQATDEVPGGDGPIRLRPAAFDAYRVFRDLALAAESRKTKFVHFESLSQESGLELIYSCINANPQLFISHSELASTIRSNVIPFATQALSEKLSFPITVRSLRVLNVVLDRYVRYFAGECEVALGLATHLLDADAAPYWKRALAMETIRNFFAHGNNAIDAYAFYDMPEGGKSIVQDMMSAFVRLSAEKPTVIGLGQQSTVPVGPAPQLSETEPTVEAAGGVAGVISTALGVTEANVAGVGSQWSLPRAPCLEQLDKTEPPVMPDTYIYTLVLECLNSLSDSLAKTVIPLTVHHQKPKQPVSDGLLHANGDSDGRSTSRNVRSQSFRKRAVPVNPLDVEASPSAPRAQAVAALVDSCWPAVLATSSTFLNAALDDQYYRNLIKAYQRFAQVAGLLRLTTARDALMTTLGKSAVPPHVLNAAVSERPATPVVESPWVLSNPKSLLSVEGIISPVDRERRPSVDPSRPMLTTRNLLCLRALLNLAIALGPSLERAFGVVVDTLRQADIVLSTISPHQMIRSASQKQTESPDVVQAFSNEIKAVESAASRLLESTADYSDEAFLVVLNTFCSLLHGKAPSQAPSPRPEQVLPPPTPSLKQRSFSGLTGVSTLAGMQIRDYKFVLPKLGNLAELNVSRFTTGDPTESGWNMLVDELIALASNNASHKEARRAAADILCKVAAEIVEEVMEDDPEFRSAIQRRTLAVLLRLIDSIYAESDELVTADIEIQGQVVDSLRGILERCGESLVAGWNRTVAVLSSVFERTGHPPERQDDEEAHIDWSNISVDLVAVPLGKTAFAATQLMCSDFLSALPQAVVPSLIELLFRFTSQNEDVNMALTTITMAWNVSDFLLRQVQHGDLESTCRQIREADDFAEEVDSLAISFSSAQWLLLLSKLQLVIASSQKEVRKAVFQTLSSIFRNHGGQLAPGTWDFTLRSIMFRICGQDVSLYYDSSQLGDEAANANRIPSDETMSMTMIQGTSHIMAQYLHLIEQVAQLPSLWETFLTRLEAYLDLERYNISAAVFQALTKVLSQIDAATKAWTGPMYRTLHLWLKRSPASVTREQKESNQDALAAYIEAGTELYRLTQQSMSMSQTRTLVENLYLAIEKADGPKYGADVNSLSPLQAKALELLKSVKTDAASTLVIVAAKLVTLHHETWREGTSSERPTFVAVSSECTTWLEGLIIAHREDADLWESQALHNALHSLRHVIEHKYGFTLEHKGTSLWRKATASALTLSPSLLALSMQPAIDSASRTAVWTEYVHIASGIVKARGLEHVMDKHKIYYDQLGDIESFKSLQFALVPRLGDYNLSNELRSLYARSIFEASIIHQTELGEIPDASQSPLQNLGTIRRGRVKKIPFSQRERMCYECFRHLIALSSKGDGSAESKSLAQAAAPFLILRLAIPIRAYIADQYLRGKKPQPLSELEELLFCFEAIKQLVFEPDALAKDPVVAGRTGENAHLHFLYPLLVEAVSVAGDRWSGADEVLTPLQAVLASVVPVSWYETS